MNLKVEPGVLSVCVYHGAQRPKDPRQLLSYNIVITTYNIVGMESDMIIQGPDIAEKDSVSYLVPSTLEKDHP